VAQWQRTLNIKDVWDTHDIPLIARTISDRLGLLPPLGDAYIDERRDELREEFADMARDPSINTEEFDAVMRELYDWSDTALDDKWNGRKVCWVKTF
jgi:hypothetical protein